MSDESKDFRNRLQKALKDAGYSAYGPTELATQFNIRFSGHPISVHAARKWLMGDAIPTQDKVRILADWLVVPADWLRFGSSGSSDGAIKNVNDIGPLYSKLIADVQKLDPPYQKLVFEFVRVAARLNADPQLHTSADLPPTEET